MDRISEATNSRDMTLRHASASQRLFLATALGCVVLDGLHVFVGGAIFVGEIFGAADLNPTAQWLAYFVWHVVTVFLILIAVAFAYLGLKGDKPIEQRKPLAYFASALLVGVALLGIALGLASGGALLATPAPYAFGVLGLLAAVGAVRMDAV